MNMRILFIYVGGTLLLIAGALAVYGDYAGRSHAAAKPSAVPQTAQVQPQEPAAK